MSPFFIPPAEPLHRIPELLGRLPLPSEVWARTERRLPEPLQRALALRHRLPPFPQPSGRQIFAAVVPAGLLLGWLASYAVDPEIMQRGGKPYTEVAVDGVQVQLPRLAYEYAAYPEDPAPFGYREMPAAEHLNAGIAEAGDYAEAAGPDTPGAAQVTDGQVLGEDASAPQPAPVTPVIQVVPQDAPL